MLLIIRILEEIMVPLEISEHMGLPDLPGFRDRTRFGKERRRGVFVSRGTRPTASPAGLSFHFQQTQRDCLLVRNFAFSLCRLVELYLSSSKSRGLWLPRGSHCMMPVASCRPQNC
jgi:hypothetical protein